SPAMAEQVLPAVHVELFADGAMNDQKVRARMSRGLAAVKVVLRLHQCLDGGNDDGQVFWPATGHDGVDGDFFHRGSTVARRDFRYNVVAVTISVAEHLFDGGHRRRANRKAVRPAFLITKIEKLLERVMYVELPRFD